MTYILLHVGLGHEKGDDAGAGEAKQDQAADDDVVPSRLLHVLVLEPRLGVVLAQTVALELALGGRDWRCGAVGDAVVGVRRVGAGAAVARVSRRALPWC